MNNNVIIEPLDVDNWLKICDLSVSEEQKTFFTVPNVYWIGISRYEEKSELFAIKANDTYVGLIGGGFDEDGVTGCINPVMIDFRYQKKGYAKAAILLMIDYLQEKLGVKKININHQKVNSVAGKMYGSLGFMIYGEDEKEYHRILDLSNR